jgi:predicted nucleotidyltransferase component of viral defense system
MKSDFKEQVKLLLDVLPVSLKDSRVALKGGTAINLFMYDMSRLSVDIDLAYLPIEARDITFANIAEIMDEMLLSLTKIAGIRAEIKRTKEQIAKQILVIRNNIAIKIELNLVIRGSVYEPVKLELAKKAQNEFKKYIEIQSLSFEDVYAGKFCAALDRGHPRDLSDLVIFFKNNIITEKLKNAFIFYLLSAGRPIAELLSPGQFHNLESLYNDEFAGMIDEQITLDELKSARGKLVDLLSKALTENDKKFLLSFKTGAPDWSLSPIDKLQEMPSIKWKLYNINNMDKSKHEEAVEKLRRVLGL